MVLAFALFSLFYLNKSSFSVGGLDRRNAVGEELGGREKEEEEEKDKERGKERRWSALMMRRVREEGHIDWAGERDESSAIGERE